MSILKLYLVNKLGLQIQSRLTKIQHFFLGYLLVRCEELEAPMTTAQFLLGVTVGELTGGGGEGR